ATPEPITMPHRRCLPCRPRQAIAITSALSPDSSTLIQMILPTASQKAGRCMSVCSCAKNVPIFAGGHTPDNQVPHTPPTPPPPAVHVHRPVGGLFASRSAYDFVP